MAEIVKALGVPKTLAALPVLDLISHLAQDLGDDFYRHFEAHVYV